MLDAPDCSESGCTSLSALARLSSCGVANLQRHGGFGGPELGIWWATGLRRARHRISDAPRSESADGGEGDMSSLVGSVWGARLTIATSRIGPATHRVRGVHRYSSA